MGYMLDDDDDVVVMDAGWILLGDGSIMSISNSGSCCKFKKGVHTPCTLGVSVSTGLVILVIFRPDRFASICTTSSTCSHVS